ncbi:hypothetical protein [Microbacterium sp. P5_E9]
MKARKRYAANPEAHLEYQRERRAAQRAADPEGYREAKRLRNKRWHDTHREQENAKLRAKHRENPEAKREAALRYYAEHGGEVKERRRAYYWANREKQLETQRQWRAREKRRREVGLPARRIHRLPQQELAANREAADDFFTRPRSPGDLAVLRSEPKPTPKELAVWARDCERARIASAIAEDADRARPVRTSEQRAREATARAKREADAAEQARMDAIARLINDRLRHEPRRTAPVHAPRPTFTMTSGGLSL